MALRTMDALDRPGVALAQVMYGEPSAALRAIFSPQSLAPTETRDILDLLGVKEHDNSPYSAVWRTVTSPIVLIGLAMATRYKVPSLKNITEYSEQVKKAAQSYGALSGFKDITQIFRDVPELVQEWFKAFSTRKEFAEKYTTSLKAIVDQFETQAGRPLTKRDTYLLSVMANKLDEGVDGLRSLGGLMNTGALRRDFTAAHRQFLDSWKAELRTIRKDVYENPEMMGRLQEAAEMRNIKTARTIGVQPGMADPSQRKKILARMTKDVDRELFKRFIQLGDPIEGYAFPRMLSSTRLTAKEQVEELLKITGGSEKVFRRQQVSAIQDVVSPSLRARKMKMLPDPEQLMQFPEYVNKDKADKLRRIIAKREKLGVGPIESQRLVEPVYDLNFIPVMEKYINTMAGTMGWTGTGAGRKMAVIIDELKRNPKNAARLHLLETSYIPAARGSMTLKQAIAAQKWSSNIDWMVEKVSGLRDKGYLPKGMADWFLKGAEQDRGPLSLGHISGDAAGWLWLSTLGLNAGSAALNLLQNFVTLIPLIGTEASIAGLGRVWRGASTYFKSRESGMIHEKALRKAFPLFAQAGLVQGDPQRALLNSLSYAWDEGSLRMPGRWTRSIDRVKRSMMAMFSTTETFNRIWAFESAYAKGLREGLHGTDLLDRSRQIVAMTQFIGGPETSPAWLVNMNPLAQQYLRFPMKMLSTVLDTATTSGSGAQSGFMGRNWGTLGRMMVASGAINEMGHAAGLDLSAGLMTGTLPIPREGSPFYPFPFVPPALAIAGSAAQAALSGEIEPLQKIAPLFIPGGVAAARFSGMIPGGRPVAELLGRHYADFETRTPDGRIPVYSKDGNLVGYETTMQMVAKGLGLPGAGQEIREENEAVPWLLKNRDRIREYRRSFLDALIKNDTHSMVSIREEFERIYQVPLVIKESHIKAAQLKRDIPRIERIIDTLPPELRPQFALMLQQRILSQGEDFLGIDPALFGQGSASQRMEHRTPLNRPLNKYYRSGTYQQSMGPFGGLNYSGIGRNQLPSVQSTQGLSFGGF